MKIISHRGGISQEVPDYAIPFRGEHPVVGPHQHTVWDGDTFDVLESEFNAMVRVLDNNQSKIEAYRSQGVLGSNISIGRELLYLLLRGGKENQADYVIKLLVASGEISKTEAKVYKGKARLEADRVSEAISYLRQAGPMAARVGVTNPIRRRMVFVMAFVLFWERERLVNLF